LETHDDDDDDDDDDDNNDMNDVDDVTSCKVINGIIALLSRVITPVTNLDVRPFIELFHPIYNWMRGPSCIQVLGSFQKFR